MAWTDEKKEAVVNEYKEIMETQFADDKERGDATIEVVKQLAEKHGETTNGTRMILTKAGVYIKKTPTATAKASGSSGKRVNKAEAIQTLKNSISAIDPELVDEDILEKLTGKAANYFVSVLNTAPTKE